MKRFGAQFFGVAGVQGRGADPNINTVSLRTSVGWSLLDWIGCRQAQLPAFYCRSGCSGAKTFNEQMTLDKIESTANVK